MLTLRSAISPAPPPPAPTPAASRWCSPRRSALLRAAGWICLAFEGSLAVASGYLLMLLLAARDSSAGVVEAPLPRPEARMRLVVLVPAHDEQDGIAATLESLTRCSYPEARRRVVVIADNCSDRTAARAHVGGAEVWERSEPLRRGKGYALAWALARLQAAGEDFDAVVIVDADCLVSPNMLSALDIRMRRGAAAVQVSYVVGNSAASHASALRFAAFALMNTVRPLGKQRFGLSCGLFGTGMAFARELLSREPWTATSLAEDGEYHMRLVQAGERVEFAPEAWVRSDMPTSLSAGSSQQARWEQGKLQLVRRWSPRLVARGLARRDVMRIHTGLECLVPPQSLIVAGSIGSMLVGLALGLRRLALLSAATLAAQLVFVLGGLRRAHAPAHVYRALLAAPALIASKLALYTRLVGGGGPTSWVRTERERSAGARAEAQAVRVAYLCAQYPAVSHTFILREVDALRQLGAEIATFSVRRTPPEQLLAQADRSAFGSTFAILPPRWGALLMAHAKLVASAPAAYLSTLALALREAPAGLRGRLWQIFYFVESVVLWSECRRRRIRHIHVHLANAAADIALLAAHLGTAVEPERPWSWSFTMHGPTEFGDVSRFRLPEKLRRARLVVCISDYARSQLMALSDPEVWDRLHVVHCGVPLEQFDGSTNGRARRTAATILCLGRLVPEKGQAVLLEAVALLAERGHSVEVVLAGEGPSRVGLERTAAQLGVAARTSFPGAVGQEQIAALYASASIFCLPSFAEGVPVVLMEAMAMRLPVVSTTIAGIPELIEDGRSGLLVAPGRADELAAALERLLSDPSLGGELGANAREKVMGEFNASRSAEQLHELFARKLATTPARR